MTNILSYILIAAAAVAILWRLHARGWKLKSPAPLNPWIATALLAVGVLTTVKKAWHMPDVRLQLNIIVAMMVLTAGIQLYQTLRDSRQTQAPPAWASYGNVCLCCFVVADAVSFVLLK